MTCLSKVVTVITYMYVAGVVLAMPYCNWAFAQKHGFLKWVFLGEVVATFQAVIWPIWLFTGNY